jgi:hypothetical protein
MGCCGGMIMPSMLLVVPRGLTTSVIIASEAPEPVLITIDIAHLDFGPA